MFLHFSFPPSRMHAHKTAAVLLGLSLLLSGIPAFADDDDISETSTEPVSSLSSSSVSSDSSSSSSSLSSSSPSVTKACEDLKGIQKSKCLRDRAKAKGPTDTVRMNTAAHERVAACKDKLGLEKAICLRSKMEKKEKFQRQVEKQQQKLDLRDQKPVRRLLKNR